MAHIRAVQALHPEFRTEVVFDSVSLGINDGERVRAGALAGILSASGPTVALTACRGGVSHGRCCHAHGLRAHGRQRDRARRGCARVGLTNPGRNERRGAGGSSSGTPSLVGGVSAAAVRGARAAGDRVKRDRDEDDRAGDHVAD